jgi:hypothetical protein
MPDPNLTPRFSIPQPIVAGDNGTWGGYLNNGMTIIDTNLQFYSDNEDLTSQITGSNTTFTLANNPNPDTSLHLYYNGIRQRPGASYDYTLSGTTITLNFTPSVGPPTDTLLADYRY